MYRHLLVKVDGAPGGIDAVGHALELARAMSARVTFVLPDGLPEAAPDSYLPGARTQEQGAKVEAAARAQGVSFAIAPAGRTPLWALARVLGCDLICVAALPPGADARACTLRQRLFAASGVPVLVCAVSHSPAAARVIARCLDAHRAVAALLHALTRYATQAGEPGRDAVACRGVLADLAGLQARRFGAGAEARLFAALRSRTESVEAELDELDRQHRRDAQALDALARMADGALPCATFDTALARYARGVFEQMGRKEGVIFPAARRYLSDADWTELDEGPADDAAATPGADEPEDAPRASD
ncbi:hemerythrin domain-containing protein [Burkholderia sp. MR1-5-21]